MIRQLLSWLFKRPNIKVTSGVEIYRMPRTALIWILASLTAVILPHISRMPIWLTLLCACCIGTSILIFQGRLSHPGSKIKTAIVFIVLVSIVAQYGRDIFSTDAIVGVLVVGIALKLLEMKKKRDVLMVIYLCYFTVLAEFIYSQSIPIAIYMMLTVLVITSALMSITQTEEYQRPMRTLKLSGIVLLQSIPLMAILFLIFPRISPFWAVPLQSTSSITGLSDEMSPGDIGDLTRSGDIAFRVEFSSEIPSYNELYWRGITLEQFDGREWSRRRFRNAQYLGVDKPQLYPWFREIQMLGDPVRYNVIMEPTQQSWVFTLMVPQLTNERLFMRREFQVGTQRPINQRMSYDASSYLDHVVDLELSRQMTINNLSIPENGNEESRAFAEQMYAEAGSDTEFINSILQHIRDNEFFYTLSPSLLGENGIDDFLFNTREGFCEHYASTFTFLMRAAGIPARVVTGYQGGEFNKYNETLIVRQYDAHAWSEVWLEGQGWVRVDPTAAVAPGRIEYGSQFTFQEDEGFLDDEVFSLLQFRSSSLLINDLILRMEMIDYAWNRFVLNYDQGMQFSLFSRLFENVNQRKILLSLLAFMFLFTSLSAFIVLRKPSKKAQTPVNALYLKFCRFLADNGISRQSGEPPIIYCDRVAAVQPQWATDVANITKMYMDLAFNKPSPEEQQEKTLQLKQAIRKFRVIN
jgi:transglutaminase-like putative cysteine protease